MPVILVIDDEQSIRDAFEILLRRKGCIVYSASDGNQGLELFYRYKPDVVFLDIRLPDRDGLEILRQLRRDEPTVRVLIISGIRDPDTIRQAIQYGAYGYLQKPLDIEVIEEIVEK